MKNLISAVLLLISVSVFGQVDSTWTHTVKIDTTKIQFNLKVVGEERVVFYSNKPIPLADRRWDWYFRLVKNIWHIEDAQQKIEQMKNR